MGTATYSSTDGVGWTSLFTFSLSGELLLSSGGSYVTAPTSRVVVQVPTVGRRGDLVTVVVTIPLPPSVTQQPSGSSGSFNIDRYSSTVTISLDLWRGRVLVPRSLYVTGSVIGGVVTNERVLQSGSVAVNYYLDLILYGTCEPGGVVEEVIGTYLVSQSGDDDFFLRLDGKSEMAIYISGPNYGTSVKGALVSVVVADTYQMAMSTDIDASSTSNYCGAGHNFDPSSWNVNYY